jgi:hypothetical protein
MLIQKLTFNPEVRKSSSVALESTSINFIFFRIYYLFNQFIKNKKIKTNVGTYLLKSRSDDNEK